MTVQLARGLEPAEALLGRVLWSSAESAAALLAGVNEAHFGDPVHRHVLVAMRALLRSNVAPEPGAVLAELRRQGLDKRFPEGRDAGVLLVDLYAAGRGVVDARYYLRLLLEAGQRQGLTEYAERLKQRAEQTDLDELLTFARQSLDEVLSDGPASRVGIEGLDLARLDQPPGPLHWLVEGRMTACTYTVLGAKPGVGKSWIAYDLAVALCTGRPWLGHAVPRPLRVLYLDAENGPDLAARRLRQLGARSAELDGRLLVNTDPLILTRPADLERLRAAIRAHKPDLVVIDTLASHAPDAESDTESMAGFLADVWTLVRSTGSSLLLLHHLRKTQQGASKDDPLDSFRGAGHLVGAADRAWILDPLAPGEPRFILRDVKPRQFPCAPPTRITVVDDPDSPADDRRTCIEVAGIEAVVESGYDSFLKRALAFIDALNGRPASTKDLVHIGLSAPDEPSERSCKAYLDRALSAGVLHKPQRGFWVRAEPGLDLDAVEPEED